MEEYKKDFKGFIIWMILFIILMFVPVLFDSIDTKLCVLYMLNEMYIGMVILTYMIYKNEKIYWYTGLMYEDACKATKKQRKTYAYKHMVKFIKASLIFIVYTILSYIFKFHYGFDIGLGIIVICAAAFSTIGIHLE